jgi:hypothetical protein
VVVAMMNAWYELVEGDRCEVEEFNRQILGVAILSRKALARKST